jgi:Pyruvate/2-oxoacid:ferredoxin oxidoreductase delta subunit
MSCGNCFGCDNCYGVCPDNAIIKLADGDYDYCKDCGSAPPNVPTAPSRCNLRKPEAP